MASIVSQTSVDENDECFLRLFFLIKKVGTSVCYNIFHRYFPKDKKQLYQKLLPFKKKLKPYLFASQRELLFGNPNKETDSIQFDITLLLLLIRNTCNCLAPPRKGWNRRPSASDFTDGANLERLRIRRNSLAHTGSTPVKLSACSKKWNETAAILISLGADPNEISYYATVQLDSNKKSDLEEELSILHDKFFHYIDISFTKYSDNEDKINRLQAEIMKLQENLNDKRISCSNDDDNLEVFGRRLKRNYMKSESLVSCLEWDMNNKGYFKLEDIYIQPRFHCWDRRPNDMPPGYLYDLVKKKEGFPVNLCFISDPGKGKSVLLQKLTMDYVNAEERFSSSFGDLSLVLLLRCKELLSYGCLLDYIEDVLLKDTNIQRCGEWKDLLVENCERCLFLIDGLDEIRHNQSEGIVAEINALLEGQIYNGASIIATSRPAGLTTIEKLSSLFNRSFIIAPFTKDDIQEYIRKYFAEKDEDFCRKLYETVVGSADILELASSPLALSIICNIHDHSEVVPRSMTQLYHELVRQMIQQFKNYHGFGDRHGKRRISDCVLKSIGHIALESIKSGKDYFEQQDLVAYFVKKEKRKGFFQKTKQWIAGVNSNSVLQLGFITADRGPNPRKVNWRYQFEPKQCQKYIAAEYIVQRLLRHGLKGIEKLFGTESREPESSLNLLKENHELCLFIVDSLGRRGEKLLCKQLFNEVFKNFGEI